MFDERSQQLINIEGRHGLSLRKKKKFSLMRDTSTLQRQVIWSSTALLRPIETSSLQSGNAQCWKQNTLSDSRDNIYISVKYIGIEELCIF